VIKDISKCIDLSGPPEVIRRVFHATDATKPNEKGFLW